MSSDSSPADPQPPNAGQTGKLSDAEATQFATAIADLAKLGLPLASGLKALADETDGTPLAFALTSLAQQLEQGVPLEEAIEKLNVGFPPHVKGLIGAGLRTGNLGETLSDFATQQRAMRVVRRRIWHAIMYPVFLLLFSLPVLGFLLFVLMPQMRESLGIYDWFQEESYVPQITQFLFQVVDQGPKIALLLFGVLAAVLLVGVLVGGTRFWDTVIRSLPVWWQTFIWSRVANFSHVLGTMLKHHIPLPEALEYTAEAVPGVGLRKESRGLAEAVARGEAFSTAVEKTGQFPALLPAFLAWGERADSVPQALDAAGEYAGQQVEVHTERIRLILPVIIFTGVAFLVGLIVIAIMTPLINLVGSLRGL